MSLTLPQKLLAVQKRIGAVTKGSVNPHFRSKYADLNEVLAVAKEALNAEGIVLVQSVGFDSNYPVAVRYVETILLDSETAQSTSCKVAFSGAEDNMQKIGAAITYARRFGLVALLALETEDDDGETAVGRSPAKPTSTPAAGVPKAAPPMETKVSTEVSRKTLNEKISQTSKVLIAKKTLTLEEATKLVTAFGVKAKEELTDDQARKLLTQLEERL
jgi:hypothetical protein